MQHPLQTNKMFTNYKWNNMKKLTKNENFGNIKLYYKQN